MEPIEITQERVEKVIDITINNRIIQIEGKISDLKETIEHSSWLSTLAVGLAAAAVAFVPNNPNLYYLIAQSFTIVFSGISLFFSASCNISANNKISSYRLLIVQTYAEKIDLLAYKLEFNNLDDLAQKIYSSKLASPHWSGKRKEIDALIETHSDGTKHTNLQIKFLLASISTLAIQSIICSIIKFVG